MAKVVLHIGTHKTGTTWIQEVMATNTALLAEHGLAYPGIGHASGHHSLIAEWVKLAKIYWLPEGHIDGWRQIAEAYADTDQTVLLSSEEFTRSNSRVDFEAIKEELSGFEEIKLVCMVRDQVSHIQSIFLELSKHRAPPGWVMFLRGALERDIASGLFLNYNELYDFLLESFDPEQIVLASYDQVKRAEGGIVQYILDQCDLGIDASILAEPDKGANKSPSPLAGWAAGVVARPDIAASWLPEQAQAALSETQGEKRRTTLYTVEELQQTIAHFKPLNDLLTQRLAEHGTDLTIDLPDWSRDDTVFRDDIKGDFWIKFASAIYHRPET